MGYLVNIEDKCPVCGKETQPGEKYCKKHRNFDDLDSEDKEKINEDNETHEGIDW